MTACCRGSLLALLNRARCFSPGIRSSRTRSSLFKRNMTDSDCTRISQFLSTFLVNCRDNSGHIRACSRHSPRPCARSEPGPDQHRAPRCRTRVPLRSIRCLPEVPSECSAWRAVAHRRVDFPCAAPISDSLFLFTQLAATALLPTIRESTTVTLLAGV